MPSPIDNFESGCEDVDEILAIYNYVADQGFPVDPTNLLRQAIVISMSCLDRYIHDKIHEYISKILSNQWPATKKFLSYDVEMHITLGAISNPTSIYSDIQNFIAGKLSYNSFMHPDKIADGLALIWSENDKWRKISELTAYDRDGLRTRLILANSRRNSIVHEADRDTVTGAKVQISYRDAHDIATLNKDIVRAVEQLLP